MNNNDGPARGFCIATPISLLMWALFIWCLR